MTIQRLVWKCNVMQTSETKAEITFWESPQHKNVEETAAYIHVLSQPLSTVHEKL